MHRCICFYCQEYVCVIHTSYWVSFLIGYKTSLDVVNS